MFRKNEKLLNGNSYGGFSVSGNEYLIFNRLKTPKPWVNIISNPTFGSMVTEGGAMFTWYKNSYLYRITPRIDDEVLRHGGEHIYLKDDTTGEIWQPTKSSLTRHGKGYSSFESMRDNLEIVIEVLVSQDKPLKLVKIQLTNNSSTQKIISATYFVQMVLGEDILKTKRDLKIEFEPEKRGLIAQNPKHDFLPETEVFLGVNTGAISFETNRTDFFGREGSIDSPQALLKFQLPSKKAVPNDPCSAISSLIRIPPKKTKSVIFCMAAYKVSSAVEFSDEVFAKEAKIVRKYWRNLEQSIEINTPDIETDVLFNKQLLYQVVSSRLWARTGFYQPGGAYGYRDQLQDVISLCWSKPEIAREHILLAASRQFFSGAVQQWWHPPQNTGVRSDSSDAHLWLVYAVVEYIKITGEKNILNENVSFLKTERSEHFGEVYYSPNSSKKEYVLIEHLEVALLRSIHLVGERGLPLILSGDWNDSLSAVGRDKRGESVWLAMFLCYILDQFSKILSGKKEKSKADYYKKTAKDLMEKIENNCWDKDWYLRAFWDSGEPLGGRENQEMKIDSIPQSWSVISGLDKKRASTAVSSANKLLFDRKNKIVRLFTPPFSSIKYDPGYILQYPPGVRENGGAYSHAAIWLAKANALLGNADVAQEIINTVNPLKRVVSDFDVQIYQGEPYVVPADIYTHGSYVGLAGWTWYTGSASLLYRVILEDALGFIKKGDRLSFRPSVPKQWNGYSIKFKHKEATYNILFKKSPTKNPLKVLVNGVEQKNNEVILCSEKKNFEVEVFYPS